MMDSLKDRVKRVMATVFNVSPAQVPDNAELMTTPGWDSLGHAQLMLALEEEFSVELPTQVVIELQSLPEIVEYFSDRATGAPR
jgi:acyl carrier protein